MSAATDSAQSIRAMRKEQIRNRIAEDLVDQRDNAAVSEKCMRKAEKDLAKLKKEGEKVNDYFDYYHKRQLWMAKKRDATDRIAGHKASLASATEKVKKLEAKLKDMEHQEEQASAPASISAPPVKTILSSTTMGETPTAVQQLSGSTTTTRPAPEENKKLMKVRKLAPELRDLAKRYEAYRDSNGAAATHGLGVVTRRKYRAQIEVVLEAYKAEGVTVELRHDLDGYELPDPEDIKQAAAEAQGKRYRRRKSEVDLAEKERSEEVHESREKLAGRSGKKRKVAQDVEEAATTHSKKRKVQAPREEENSNATQSIAPGSPKRKRDEIASAQSVNSTTPAGAADNDEEEDDDEDDQPPTKRSRRLRPQQQVSTFQALMGETNTATTSATSTPAKKRKVDSDEVNDSEHADERAKIDSPPPVIAGTSAAPPKDSKSPETTTSTTTISTTEAQENQKAAQEAKRKAIFSIKPAYYHSKQRRTSDSSSSSNPSVGNNSHASKVSSSPRNHRATTTSIKTRTLRISPLPPSTTPSSVRDLLTSFGFGRDVVEGVSVKGSSSSSASSSASSGASGGAFAFVKFYRVDEARAAVREMDGVRADREGGGRSVGRLRVEGAREEMR